MTAGTAAPVLAQSCLWRQRGPAPAYNEPSITYDTARRAALLVAGDGSVREWTGTDWLLITSGGIPFRYSPAVSFDSARSKLVFHGGSFGALTLYSDTWEWDGLGWTLAAQGGPAGNGAMVFDAARAVTVRYQPGSGSGPAQTWTWNGLTWSLAASSGPPSRTGFAVAYDSDRQRVLLHGGGMADMWEWDGFVWAQTVSAPIARTRQGMAYDPVRHRVVVHGGYINQSSPLTDTWEFDPVAATWLQRSSNGASGNTGQAMVFDTARGRAMLLSSFNTTNELWEWDGNGTITPVVIAQQPRNQEVSAGAAATFSVLAQSTGALTYQWQRNNTPLNNGGNISGADSATLTIQPAGAGDIGSYRVTVTNGCTTSESGSVTLYIFGSPCYPNCDGSTVAPVLNANDFQCFLNRVAEGSLYANCVGSTVNPVITSGDFQCFLNAFAYGCP